MSHWQLFIVGASFAYFVIAAGLYAWMTSKVQPYLGLLPPELTPAFVKLIMLITSFGWPLCLQVYVYFEIIDKMMNLAGVNWKEIANVDTIRMQFANKQQTVLDSDQFIDSVNGKKLAERVAEVSFIMEVDGQIKEAVFRDPNTIAEMLCDPRPLAEFLRAFARSPISPTHGPDGTPIHVPSAEETNRLIASLPVAPMTRAPHPDEIIKLDNQALMKLVYAIAADRAVACQALGIVEADATEYAERGAPYDQLEKSCAHARAVVEAWMDLVK